MRVLTAYLYYSLRTGRNRAASIVGKLKRPRYLLGLLLVAAYLWFFFVRPFGNAASWTQGDAADGKWSGGLAIASITGLYWLQFATAWIFGPWSKGLLFRESEVQWLFPAPLLRRHLLLFKWVQQQAGLAIFAVIMSIGYSRLAGGSFARSLPVLWLVSNVFNLHSNFVSLLMLRLRERRWPLPLLLIPGVMILGGLIACLAQGWPSGGGPKPFGVMFQQILETPWMTAYLAPFRALLEPLGAVGAVSFLVKLSIPIGALAAMAFLVIKNDVAFEEQSIALAQIVTRTKSEGVDALKPAEHNIVAEDYKPIFQLGPLGRGYIAFVWKNLISIGRMNRRIWFSLAFAVVVLFVSVALSANRSSENTRAIVGIVLLAMVFYSSLFGANIIRVDLRLDIPHFDVLRAMPIRGRELILGEVLATSLVLFALQSILVILSAFLTDSLGEFEFGVADRAMYAIGALVLLLGLDVLLVTAENLLALYFPSFVRLGRGVKVGIENFGQQLIGAMLRLLCWFIFVAIPGVLAVFIGIGLYAWLGVLSFSILVAAIIAGSLLLVESWLLMIAGERRYESFDLSAETLSVE